jgi:lipopolysaccharide transport system ATP-binding protein
MSDIAVRVDGLGKRYRIALPQERHNTLRDALAHRARRTAQRMATLGRAPSQADGQPDHIWALRDMSFEVERGSVVGIIGANGAGKSTLLKILSRITEPTEGEVQIRGRVGSLLEVGTGFHSELSGRENLYLSGAILGMRRHEIDRKFDEIVAFSEVGPFIDTPVKHYSSGMYLRLAFAVAAHLEPEILIVDEVLAVGDASFQKKCLGKMSDVAGEGRTVLFVSHNMEAIQRLSSRCILLENGRHLADGPSTQVITAYLARTTGRSLPDNWIDLTAAQRRGSGGARFAAVRYSSGEEAVGGQPYPFGPLEFELAIDSDTPRTVPSLAVTILTPGGMKLINADTVLHGQSLHLTGGRNMVRMRLPELHLNPGVYGVGLWLAASAIGSAALDWIEAAFDLEVMVDPRHSWGSTPVSHGVVAARFEVTQETREPAVGSVGTQRG